MTRFCTIEGCTRKHYAHGLCEKHNRRMLRHGTTDDPKYPRGLDLRAMLLARASVRGPDECWEWAGHRDSKGLYGRMKVDGVWQAAHRLMFFVTHGYWPVETRHSCDNPPCINPVHLLDGDRQRNVNDRVERGRSARLPGRSNPNARYTEEQIGIVVLMWSQGCTGPEIVEATGINRNAVYRIKNGQR